MKKFLLASVALGGLALSAPGVAAPLLPGTTDIVFDDFSTVIATQGTLLAEEANSGSALPTNPFAGEIRSAVFLNTLGTLDFYYQVMSTGGDPVDQLTFSDFTGYSTYAYYLDADPDGGGVFGAQANTDCAVADCSVTVPTVTGAQSTASRNGTGSVVRVQFQFPAQPPLGLPATMNPVEPGQTSATYIYRTNATQYTQGLASAQDSATYFVPAFAPGVPEPATWAMMLVGFGAVGYSLRRRKAYRLLQAV